MLIRKNVGVRRVAIIGAGWAGLAAAVRAVQAGHQVTVFESSRSLGGRARAVEVTLPSGERVTLDNGQHVLLGAYRETLDLMQTVGADLTGVLTRLPVKLATLQTQHWTVFDYVSLARVLVGWCLRGFSCPQGTTVLALSQSASPRVMKDVIESLCLSALNTAPAAASGQVFLRVLKDAFLSKSYVYAGGKYASFDMLIPSVDLGSIFPSLASSWLQGKGARVRLGERVASLQALQSEFDHVVVATPPWEAARLLRDVAPDWAASVERLLYRAIATVYAQAPADFELPKPMLALPSDAEHPAQFVFARREASGLLAFVVSDAKGERETLEQRVLAQGEAKLGVALRAVSTIVEKRATLACTAPTKRPAKLVLAGLSVVGDYVDGPYPSTLEGAVRSAL
ncbi:MAG: FAD-dependent oxidoreductase [Cytophagales bacterium]|nr:FAD-dependent oxidoreductase [Cytophagales bacterium]